MEGANTAFVPERAAEPKPGPGNPAPMPVVPTTAPMTRLAAFVEDQFRINRDHRASSGVDAMLERAGRAARMKYTKRQEAILAANGLDPKVYPPLIPMKIRMANANLEAAIKSHGTKFVTISPTPSPSVPEAVKRGIERQIEGEIARYFDEAGASGDSQTEAVLRRAIRRRVGEMYDEARRRLKEWARERCDRMDEKIHDQFVEGGFVREYHRLVPYITTYGTGVMVGPCPRVVARCRNVEVEGVPDALKYEMAYEEIPTYEAVSPWDCYPAPNAKGVGDGALCIKVRYAANTLWQYAEAGGENKASGWQPRTVRALLSRYPNGGLHLAMEPYEVARRDIERDGSPSADDCTMEGIRCFASVRGSMLISFGVVKAPDGSAIVYHRYYKTETIVMGGYVVYCRVIDDRMPLPVAKVTMYEAPDSWWGDTLADLCAVPQSMQNNAFKNMTVNGSLSSSGMMVCTDVNSVVSLDGSPALALRGGKVFGFRRHMGGGLSQSAPLSMINVPDVSERMLKIMQAAIALADDYSGIPQFTVGSTTTLGSGAGRTASGMAMMSEANTRIINEIVVRMGNDLLVPMARNTYVYNLLNDNDMSIKGDVDIEPTGMMGKILREAESQHRQQVMSMVGQHPVYSKGITMEGHFELLRPELENIGVNPDKIIPSKERMEALQRISDLFQMSQTVQQPAAQPPQGAADAGAPTADQARLARMEGVPEQVAMESGEPAPGTVAERRSAA